MSLTLHVLAKPKLATLSAVPAPAAGDALAHHGHRQLSTLPELTRPSQRSWCGNGQCTSAAVAWLGPAALPVAPGLGTWPGSNGSPVGPIAPCRTCAPTLLATICRGWQGKHNGS
jgi:hypothetical protein